MAKTDAQKFKLSKGPSKLVKAAKTVANYVGPGKKVKTAAKLAKAVNKVIKAKRVKRNAELTKGEPARLNNLMKALKKDGTLNKSPVKKKSYKAYVESTGSYGEPGMKPMGGVAKSAKAFAKKLENKGQTVYSKPVQTKAPWKASQERKVKNIQELRSEVAEANRYNGYNGPTKTPYKLPRYTVKRPKIK